MRPKCWGCGAALSASRAKCSPVCPACEERDLEYEWHVLADAACAVARSDESFRGYDETE